MPQPQAAFEIGHHVQELEPEHPRVDGAPMEDVEAGVESLIDDRACRAGLLAHGEDSTLKDSCVPPEPCRDGSPRVRQERGHQ